MTLMFKHDKLIRKLERDSSTQEEEEEWVIEEAASNMIEMWY